ncbi:YigZ family protein [Kaistella daneshvariae]|uniref:YigZ family protein n=1 Tax=Kaistella daneshvariae TaxID=2487074 RepID=A0ABM7C9M2_9FLAO|nr:YigZ family protein [Kaistella daneshvariae]AZI67706.1 YigZ family protein [Kaistella daneshvariae]
MEFSFETIQEPVADIFFREKGSKFIGFAFPVRSDAEIKDALQQIKEIHPKATHHCYAFRLGINGENYRANDDGEPSGSAGLPIYNQLLAHNLTNILVIVVRYYGGTKLGVSGLVRAYKECAKSTLEEAEIITEELQIEIAITFDFSRQNVIFTLLNKFNAKILDFLTEENCTIKALIKTAEKESISNQLAEMQNISFKFLD